MFAYLLLMPQGSDRARRACTPYSVRTLFLTRPGWTTRQDGFQLSWTLHICLLGYIAPYGIWSTDNVLTNNIRENPQRTNNHNSAQPSPRGIILDSFVQRGKSPRRTKTEDTRQGSLRPVVRRTEYGWTGPRARAQLTERQGIRWWYSVVVVIGPLERGR